MPGPLWDTETSPSRAGAEPLRPLRHLSIRSKIIGIILLTNVMGLGLVLLLIFQSVDRLQHDEFQKNAEAIAWSTADYSVISLVFADEEDAEYALGRLKRYDNFLEARIYGADRSLFTSYPESAVLDERGGSKPRFAAPELPANMEQKVSRFYHGYLDVFVPIEGNVTYNPKARHYGMLFSRFSTAEFERGLSAYGHRLVGMYAISVIASIALSFMLGRLLSRPLLRLTDVARRISRDGDYSIRVDTIGRDEIAILCEVFNDMLNQIQLRQQELERSNRELDHFAYVTTHDLKAPLRAISTLSGWIEEDLGKSLPEDTAEHLNLLRGRVQRMEALIDGILEYSRVGRVDVDLELVDVRQLISEVVELVGVPQSFTVQVGDGMPVFVTRRVRLQQVLSNLISNAIKYSDREDGRIEISVRTLDDGRYEFSVADNGPGIAPEYHDRVFLIFQTLQSRDVIESTGVGLALVKKIVENEGGRVTLESEDGKGATFRFTWPSYVTPARGHLTAAAA